ncbi:hypothetical protein C4559_01970 [Candidatus Microgenomates bacterium]|nr:MAG: hypothetical protein C4559_01970 [Candidatus Microgenomates bacterium]
MSAKYEKIRQKSLEISPDGSVIDTLYGVISDPIETISYKPGPDFGKLVNVRIVKDGVGLLGLTDWKDNKEWSGIVNHVLLSTRYDLYFSQKMAEKGCPVNLKRAANGMISSHDGRRVWDEANWYKGAVENGEVKRNISNETLGMQLVLGKIPQDAFELVVALGHNVEGFKVDPKIYDSWDYKIAIYVDHRTTQQYESLNTRMGDFLLGNFFERDQVTPQLKRQCVYKAVKKLIEERKKGPQEVSLDEADQVAEELGAKPESPRLIRKELMRLILQDADTEAQLIKAGVDVDNINDQTVPMPKWEQNFRMEYIKSAKEGIIERLGELYLGIEQGDEMSSKILDQEFPLTTWWGQYARSVYIL